MNTAKALDVAAKEFVPISAKLSPTSLDADAKEFVPKIKVDSTLFYNADELVYSILKKSSSTEYYIKGGKAFHYYYPFDSGYEYVPTEDFDLVATNEVCTFLFEEMNKIVLGNLIQLEQSEPFLVQTITISDDSWVDTVRHGKHKSKTKNRVKTLRLNDIGFIDVIITEKVNNAELFQSESGISYMDFELFRKDLKQVYQDRRQKVLAKGWEKRPELYEKIKNKHGKSFRRYLISCA